MPKARRKKESPSGPDWTTTTTTGGNERYVWTSPTQPTVRQLFETKKEAIEFNDRLAAAPDGQLPQYTKRQTGLRESQKDRHKCSVCGKPITINGSGKLRSHKDNYGEPCDGEPGNKV